MDLKEGSLLLATKDLGAGFFRDALILVVVYNNDGAFGLILNRGAKMPITEVFDPVPKAPYSSRLFFIGGPVEEEVLHILTICDEPGGGYPFTEGVELGGDSTDIEDVLMTHEERSLLFLGYSGWSAGQLEGEIEEGSWDLYNGVNIRALLDDVVRLSRAERQELLGILEKHQKRV